MLAPVAPCHAVSQSGVFTTDNKLVIKKCQEQMMRFLQGQGVDTKDIDEDHLKTYLTGEPIWFVRNGKSVRIPLAGLSKRGQTFKAPPAEVPEVRLLAASLYRC